MKTKIIILLCSGLFSLGAFAQRGNDDDNDRKGGFKKENLFTGGNVNLGFGSGTTSFGIGPYFGYSINKYIDAAISLNYQYVSQKQFVYGYDYEAYLGKVRQNVIGPGAFVKIFPVKFLYVQAQYEQNFLTYKFLPADNSGFAAYKETHSVPSVLLGIGLASGRSEDSKSYGYISLLIDVAKDRYSPYVDGQGDITPVIRAGYNIALFQGGRSNRSRRL